MVYCYFSMKGMEYPKVPRKRYSRQTHNVVLAVDFGMDRACPVDLSQSLGARSRSFRDAGDKQRSSLLSFS